MLTRLKVSGFKNLVDVDVRFGPFTCIAGANGVGKSNLFDAIRFLSALADRPLVDAAQLVRSEDDRRGGDIRGIFHRVGDSYSKQMSFEAEMIVPSKGLDDLNQTANATTTFLRYSVTIGYRDEDKSLGELELLHEQLTHYNQREATRNLLFRHSPAWRKSIIVGSGRNNGSPFISTIDQDDQRFIMQHQDGGSSGRPFRRIASQLPRTIISASNALESPTALIARREMQSWRLLQLEPSAMRKPDDFNAPVRISMDGSHLPATLYSLASRSDNKTIYTKMANRLSDLLDDVHSIYVDRDEKRELYTLMVSSRDGTSLPAKSLSDGTLRFLALGTISLDPNAGGVLCMEEPENGIHPQRIPAILDLLQAIAVDPEEEVNEDNPLRQVIINTHSPSVVQQIPDESLLFAQLVEQKTDDLGFFKGVRFSYLSDTWRARTMDEVSIVSRGDILAYLNPVPHAVDVIYSEVDELPRPRRVIDRADIQQLLLPLEFEVE